MKLESVPLCLKSPHIGSWSTHRALKLIRHENNLNMYIDTVLSANNNSPLASEVRRKEINIVNITLSKLTLQRVPVIMKGLNVGFCVDKWSVEYLADTAGDRPVKVHVSPVTQMDFINKNFLYRYESLGYIFL